MAHRSAGTSCQQWWTSYAVNPVWPQDNAPQNGIQGGVKDGTQDGAEGGTQGDPQDIPQYTTAPSMPTSGVLSGNLWKGETSIILTVSLQRWLFNVVRVDLWEDLLCVDKK